MSNEVINANTGEITDIIVTNENGELTVAKEALEIIRKNERMKREAKRIDDHIKAELLASMEKYGIKKISADDFTASYVEAYDAFTFDSKTFKEVYPEIYEQYMKCSPRKASVMVRMK